MFNTPQYDEDEQFSIPSPMLDDVSQADDALETGWTRRRVVIAFVAVIVIIALLGLYLLPIIRAWEIEAMLRDLARQFPIFEERMRT